MKRPILRYITTCPHCHNPLQDEVRDGIEVKVCYSDTCMVECGDKGKVWEAFDYDNNGD